MSGEHIAFPFGTGATDQDSAEEIRDCALVALMYAPGSRPNLPTFGAQPSPHRMGGVDLQKLQADLTALDPRTAPLATGNDPALLAIAQTLVTVQTGSPT